MDKKLEELSVAELKEILFDAREELEMLQSRYNQLRASIVPLINQKLEQKQQEEHVDIKNKK